MNKRILLLALVIALVIAGYFLFRINRTDNTVQLAAGKTVISMTENGFSPSVINIKQGETVAFKNIGSQDHWPASAIHPTHQIYPEFDPKKPIAPRDSWPFTFTKKGIWRYHDHLNPGFAGTINVE